jgi:hypothetical protein
MLRHGGGNALPDTTGRGYESYLRFTRADALRGEDRQAR